MQRSKPFLLAVLPLVTFLTAVGCTPAGPPTTPVEGTVSLDGTPLTNGYVMFRDKSGDKPSAAGQIADGKYQVDVQPGQKTVEITSTRDVPGKFDMSNPGQKVQLTEQFVPSQYNTETTLTTEIGDEPLTLNYDLKSS
ncbi:hypothetical protein [Roseimaritima ulvae]|uniref:Carboxypeptidase regulatory-like domain-containing protein n=1 Tax=Roseimaritima ulvae TaxID=980254 RepID=A0A5B9QRR1_9BACT|nr:hypothetical protein [Roseimaritima ulvae]QEG40642.1 hypothetical protein UC8_26590 [Roseimaritima ulvae]